MSISQFVEEHPSSSLSISLIQAADEEEQRELLPLLISNAVFADAWLVYFEFVRRNSLAVSDEIILNAMQSVGLDPYSVPLWLLAIELCNEPHSKQALYSVALSIPLYNSEKLREKYSSMINLEGSESVPLLTDAQIDKINEVLNEEKWPDKYINVLTNSNERCKIKNEWITLLEQMLQLLYSEDAERKTTLISTDVQCRRIRLAFEQMCAQLHNDEDCWYLYALFEFIVMIDRKSAVDTLLRGIQICNDNSFVLRNLHAAIHIEENADANNTELNSNYAEQMPTIKQRSLIEKFIEVKNKRKENIRAFRNIGKHAASDGICDWSLFSQWWKAENVIVNDVKMASKVLENGLVCCSTQLESRCALSSESISFHLLHGHDRECIANGEEQITVASSTQLRDLRECAQNTLSHTKRLLGINTDAQVRQHTEKLTSTSSLSHLLTFINNYRVSNFLPCSAETYNWCVMWNDSKEQKALEKFSSSYNVINYAHARLSSSSRCNGKVQNSINVLPDCNMWTVVELPTNTVASTVQDFNKSNANTDQVVGPRELRGKWVYRPHISESTAARVRWEQSKLAELKETTSSEAETIIQPKPISLTKSVANTNISSLIALKKLTDKLNTLYLNNYQRTELLNASTAWITRQLTINDLDLRSSLTRRRRERC